MANNWMRMINSAQRSVKIESPRTLQTPGLQALNLNIQGMELVIGGRSEFVTYESMMEHGIRRGWAKPLGIWQRLRRQQAPLGWLRQGVGEEIQVHFWSPSPLVLLFDLEKEQEGVHWRECEIMVMSGGFHFSEHPDQVL